jgi:hypothetical protein
VEVVEIDLDSDAVAETPRPAGRRSSSAGKENRAAVASAAAAAGKPAAPAAAGGQQQKLPSNCVACPICGMSVKAGLINAHLDTCLSKAAPAAAPAAAPSTAPRAARGQGQPIRLPGARPSPTGPAAAAAPRQPQQQPQQQPAAARQLPPLEPPTKLCFAMMKDRDLKKKLTDLGLSGDGSKQARGGAGRSLKGRGRRAPRRCSGSCSCRGLVPLPLRRLVQGAAGAPGCSQQNPTRPRLPPPCLVTAGDG